MEEDYDDEYHNNYNFRLWLPGVRNRSNHYTYANVIILHCWVLFGSARLAIHHGFLARDGLKASGRCSYDTRAACLLQLK